MCEACCRPVTRHKQDASLTYHLLVDSKGKIGKSDAKLVILKRTKHFLSAKMIPALPNGQNTILLKLLHRRGLTYSSSIYQRIF